MTAIRVSVGVLSVDVEQQVSQYIRRECGLRVGYLS
jgi:hypothetical protein